MKNPPYPHLSAENLQIGDRIKLRMKHVNCSRSDVARRCKVTERTIYNWCENKSTPELKHISALCFTLHSHIPWLITGSTSQYQWVDDFPEGFLDFLHVVKSVSIYNRGHVLRSAFDMIVNLNGYINLTTHKVNTVYFSVDRKKTYKNEQKEDLCFDERLKVRKNDLSLTNKDIGVYCGVSSKTIYNWSLGKSSPNIELCPLLCDILDVNLSWLITGTCDIPQWLNIPQEELKEILYQLNKLPIRTVSQVFKLTSLIVQEFEQLVIEM